MFLTLRKPNPSNPKSNRLFIAIFVIGLILTSAYFISAQEDTRPDRSNLQQQGRGQRGEDGEAKAEGSLIPHRWQSGKQNALLRI